MKEKRKRGVNFLEAFTQKVRPGGVDICVRADLHAYSRVIQAKGFVQKRFFIAKRMDRVYYTKRRKDPRRSPRHPS
jgi:hypothetical protein